MSVCMQTGMFTTRQDAVLDSPSKPQAGLTRLPGRPSIYLNSWWSARTPWTTTVRIYFTPATSAGKCAHNRLTHGSHVRMLGEVCHGAFNIATLGGARERKDESLHLTMPSRALQSTGGTQRARNRQLTDDMRYTFTPVPVALAVNFPSREGPLWSSLSRCQGTH